MPKAHKSKQEKHAELKQSKEEKQALSKEKKAEQQSPNKKDRTQKHAANSFWKDIQEGYDIATDNGLSAKP